MAGDMVGPLERDSDTQTHRGPWFKGSALFSQESILDICLHRDKLVINITSGQIDGRDNNSATRHFQVSAHYATEEEDCVEIFLGLLLLCAYIYLSTS